MVGRMIASTHLLIVVGIAGCALGCQVDESTGTCTGRVGGIDVSGAIDPQASEYHTLWPKAQARVEAMSVLTLSCAGAKLRSQITLPRVLALPMGETDYPASGANCPVAAPPPDAGAGDASPSDASPGDASPADAGSDARAIAACTSGSRITAWTVSVPGASPGLAHGTMEATLGAVYDRIDGTATLLFADGSRVAITFGLREASDLDDGERPSGSGSSSSSSGGGHSHHH